MTTSPIFRQWLLIVAITSIIFVRWDVLGDPSNSTELETKVEQARQKAYKEYPDLLVPGSLMYETASALIQQMRRKQPNFFNDPEWPLTLAKKATEQVAKIREEQKEKRLIELQRIHGAIQSDEYGLGIIRSMGARPGDKDYDKLANKIEELKQREGELIQQQH